MRTRKGGLAGTRIYKRGHRFYLYARRAAVNPRTGKLARWHSLCPVTDGEDKAKRLAAAIEAGQPQGAGDVPGHMETYKAAALAKRAKRRPQDPERARIFDAGNRDLERQCQAIAEGLADFDVADVQPVDIAAFLDQWEGRRMAQVYRGRLVDFFAWACRKGYRADNPAREIAVEPPERRQRYITDEEFHAIRDALATGKDGRATQSGPMVQCFVDLVYLTLQRPTDIRLLRWAQISAEAIEITPTKTERSSGASVAVPVTPEIKAVLERARAIGNVKSLYVIHTRKGKPYTTLGLGTAWKRACARAGVKGATTRDLRSKAITDARRAGYSLQQLRVAAAHASEQMTSHYVKHATTPEADVRMRMPANQRAKKG
jgi:integrase